MTLRKLLDRVQHLYSKGIQSQSSRLRDRYVYSIFSTNRSKVLEEKKNKKQSLSQGDYQTIPCLKLIQAPLAECIPLSISKDCNLWRTEEKIPNIISSKDGHMIQSVTSLDNSVRYSSTTWEDLKYKLENKYTGSNPMYFIFNDYLWIKRNNCEEYITLTAIFDDFIKVHDLIASSSSVCVFYKEKEVPLVGRALEAAIQLTINEAVARFSSSVEDQSTNALDNVTLESK